MTAIRVKALVVSDVTGLVTGTIVVQGDTGQANMYASPGFHYPTFDAQGVPTWHIIPWWRVVSVDAVNPNETINQFIFS